MRKLVLISVLVLASLSLSSAEPLKYGGKVVGEKTAWSNRTYVNINHSGE